MEWCLCVCYDALGSVLSINNGSDAESYDMIDRLNRMIGPWGTITYKFDEVRNRL